MNEAHRPGGLTSGCPVSALLAALVVASAALASCGDVAVASDPAGSDAIAASTGAVTTAEYCELVTRVCGTAGANAQYRSVSACLSLVDVSAGLPVGTREDNSGNSIACRLLHAGVAQQESPETHCPHAGPSGGDVCGSWCDNYCHVALRNCRGADAQFTSESDCLESCARVQALSGEEAVECRISLVHAAGAGSAAETAQNCGDGALGAGACP